MKALNEILWENVLCHLDLGENDPYDDMPEFEKDLLDSVKVWLEQHSSRETKRL